MKPSIAKMLEKSWAPVFYEEVFCKINEEIYAPRYCLDKGRLSLAHDVLHQAVRIIPTDLLSDTLKPVLEKSFKNDLLYKTRNHELPRPGFL
jgi:hypothetical protein